MNKSKSRILLIAMADSVHVARWLEVAAADTDALEILLIPTSPHRRVHPQILKRARDYDSVGKTGVRLHPILKYISLPIWLIDRVFGTVSRVRAWFIRRAIRSFHPDFVHIMETQNGGYAYLTASAKLDATYRTMLTLFGSDLYWYSRFPEHANRISKLLSKIDTISAECERDLALARGLGFKGQFLPLTPVSGGIKAERIAEPESPATFSKRRIIAVKGYGGTWGQGALAIEALGGLATSLSGYQVVIFSCGHAARRAARRHLRPAGIDYRLHKKSSLSHEALLDIFRHTRIFAGVSKSDGLPATMLEAMSQGAYPVQTGSACIQGWFDPTRSGSELREGTVVEIQAAFAFALAHEAFLLEAQALNLATMRARYTLESLNVGVQPTYKSLFASF